MLVYKLLSITPLFFRSMLILYRYAFGAILPLSRQIDWLTLVVEVVARHRMVEEGEHLGHLAVVGELVSTAARRSSIRQAEVEVELRSHFGHNPVDNHHSHNLEEEGVVEELLAAKEQRFHREAHSCYSCRCLVVVAMVRRLVHSLHDLRDRGPRELHHLLRELACPKDSLVQRCTQLGRTLLGHFRDTLRVRRWMVHPTTPA